MGSKVDDAFSDSFSIYDGFWECNPLAGQMPEDTRNSYTHRHSVSHVHLLLPLNSIIYLLSSQHLSKAS